jgi:hypothetical protein
MNENTVKVNTEAEGFEQRRKYNKATAYADREHENS